MLKVARRSAIGLLLVTVLSGQAMVDGGEPRIGPATDRVGLPPDYRSTFTHFRTAPAGKGQTLTVYGNEPAASVQKLENLPYPYGSVIVAEWRRAGSDDGEPFQIDVMRREKGFGEAYGDVRTGEWEYVRYRPDGGHLIPPGSSGWCASCHLKAGKERDWVYHGRF
jgi:hypothetical protein